jgi:molybdenum cofactor synthesis domain
VATDAVVITVSDRAAAGTRADESGPLGARLLTEGGWPARIVVVPDERDAIARAVRDAAVSGARLIVTTGGTGLGPRDVTPEATRPLIRIELPGIAERVRASGTVPTAALSRGIAGVVGDALLVNLAGSPGAVRDGIPVVLDVAAHALAQLDGRDHG